MAIAVQKLDNEIGFGVSGELLKQVHEWEHSLDEMVFKEQLSTGSYKGKYTVEGIVLDLMQKAEQAGKIMPYYGAGGSSGACVYKFRLNGSKCTIIVEHLITNNALNLEADIQEVNGLSDLKRNPEIQFSFLSYVTDEQLDHPWTGERNQVLVCKIYGIEYYNLTQWKNWVDEQALTPRYIYEFGQVSMGTGFSVEVKDTKTGDLIDVTDYDSW